MGKTRKAENWGNYYSRERAWRRRALHLPHRERLPGSHGLVQRPPLIHAPGRLSHFRWGLHSPAGGRKRNNLMSKSTIGLNFSNLTQPQANALRARLNDLAGDLGYVARSGPTTGRNRGVLAHMLVGIDAGEVAVVKLNVVQFRLMATILECRGTDLADVVAASFRAALEREAEAKYAKIRN